MKATSRRKVVTYTRCSTLHGRFRRWVNYRVLGYQYETCDRCGGRWSGIWWCDDDSLFAHTHRWACNNTPGGLLCPRCFARFATKADVRVVWHAVVEP